MRITVILGGVVAVLLAIVSLGGLVAPGMYVRESADWATQAVAQDGFDLAVAAPVIAGATLATSLGSRRAAVVLAGGLVFAAYTLAIYCFSIHFNAMFLIYVATLGLAGWGLLALAIDLARRIEPIEARGARLAGGVLIAIGVAFSLLWLAEDLPAVLGNRTPASLTETGLFTNPVHVIDLAFVLPVHVLAGVWLLRRRGAGELLGPVVLAFGVLMAASIGGMLVVMYARGFAAPLPVIGAMAVTAIVTAAVLIRVLRPHSGVVFAGHAR